MRTVYVPVIERPADELLMPCEFSPPVIETNSDLVLYAIRLFGAYKKCASKVGAISDFFIGLKTK